MEGCGCGIEVCIEECTSLNNLERPHRTVCGTTGVFSIHTPIIGLASLKFLVTFIALCCCTTQTYQTVGFLSHPDGVGHCAIVVFRRVIPCEGDITRSHTYLFTIFW